MLFENIKMAMRAITSNKLRTLLTILGIIIGVGSVSAVIAIGNGVKAAFAEQVDEIGTNLIQVNPGQPFDGEHGASNFASMLGSSTLTEKDVETIEKLEGIEAVAPGTIVSGVPMAGDKQGTGGIIFATTDRYDEAIKTNLEHGRFLNPDERNSVVLGSKIAQTLFGKLDVVGQTVTIRNEEFKIVGVTEKAKEDALAFGPGLDSLTYIPFEDGKEFSGGNANINEIEVKVDHPEKVGPVKEGIKKALKKNHGGEEDFSVSDAKEQLKVFDTFFTILTSFVAAIAGISLLVGGIGIMNIMLVSVTERTREIGLRKALGATSGMVLSQFLIEAVVLTLMGGALGLGFAWLLGMAASHLANITPVFTPEAIGIAVGISTLIGLLFGIAPAWKASRMKPIDALRYE